MVVTHRIQNANVKKLWARILHAQCNPQAIIEATEHTANQIYQEDRLSFIQLLLSEKAAGVESAVVAVTPTVRAGIASVFVVVLLHLVLENTANDGTADRAEDTVVCFVAGETARKATGNCATESTFAILSFTGGSLVIATFIVVSDDLVGERHFGSKLTCCAGPPDRTDPVDRIAGSGRSHPAAGHTKTVGHSLVAAGHSHLAGAGAGVAADNPPDRTGAAGHTVVDHGAAGPDHTGPDRTDPGRTDPGRRIGPDRNRPAGCNLGHRSDLDLSCRTGRCSWTL